MGVCDICSTSAHLAFYKSNQYLIKTWATGLAHDGFLFAVCSFIGGDSFHFFGKPRVFWGTREEWKAGAEFMHLFPRWLLFKPLPTFFPPCCVTVHRWMCSAPSRLCFPLTKHSTWLPALCWGSVGYWNINWSAINGAGHRCGLTFFLWRGLIEQEREAKATNVPYMTETCPRGGEGGQNVNTWL